MIVKITGEFVEKLITEIMTQLLWNYFVFFSNIFNGVTLTLNIVADQ